MFVIALYTSIRFFSNNNLFAGIALRYYIYIHSVRF